MTQYLLCPNILSANKQILNSNIARCPKITVFKNPQGGGGVGLYLAHGLIIMLFLCILAMLNSIHSQRCATSQIALWRVNYLFKSEIEYKNRFPLMVLIFVYLLEDILFSATVVTLVIY